MWSTIIGSMHIIHAYIRSTHDGPVQHAMDTEDELEGLVASGGGWHRAGGRGRGGRAGGGRHGAGGVRVGGGGRVGGGSGAGGRGGRAGGASAARNGHRGRVGGVSAAQSALCTIKKTEAKSEREWPPALLPRQLALLRQPALLQLVLLGFGLQLVLLGFGLQLHAALLRQLALLQLCVALFQLHVFARAPSGPSSSPFSASASSSVPPSSMTVKRRAIASGPASSYSDTRNPAGRVTVARALTLTSNCIPECD